MPWFVWLLLALQFIIFVWLFTLSGKSKKRDDNTASGREEKIFHLYGQIEEMLDSFEAYVGEMHAQLEEKRTELIELNRQAQVVYMQTLEGTKSAEQGGMFSVPAPIPAPVQPPTPPKAASPRKHAEQKKQEDKRSRLTDKDKEALGRFATKPQKVRFLMSRGLSIDEVARELDIGKGEVLLIADLDKT